MDNPTHNLIPKYKSWQKAVAMLAAVSFLSGQPAWAETVAYSVLRPLALSEKTAGFSRANAGRIPDIDINELRFAPETEYTGYEKYADAVDALDVQRIKHLYVERIILLLSSSFPEYVTSRLAPTIIVGTQTTGELESGVLRTNLYALAKYYAKDKGELTIEDGERINGSLGFTRRDFPTDSFERDEEMLSLATQLSDLGFSVARSDRRWPRDKLLIADGSIFVNTPEAEGGAILYSPKDNFVIISDALNAEARATLTRALYGKARVYVVPSGFLRIHTDGETDIPVRNPHIDLSVGILQDAKILLVDPYYYNHSQFKGYIDEIASAEGYKIVLVNEEEAYLHPANCLTLPDGTVVMEKAPRTISAIREIESAGRLKIIQVAKSMSASILRYGSIRCASNYFYPVIKDLMDQGFNRDELASFAAFLESHREEISVSSAGDVSISPRGQEILARDLLLRLVIRQEKMRGSIDMPKSRRLLEQMKTDSTLLSSV